MFLFLKNSLNIKNIHFRQQIVAPVAKVLYLRPPQKGVLQNEILRKLQLMRITLFNGNAWKLQLYCVEILKLSLLFWKKKSMETRHCGPSNQLLLCFKYWANLHANRGNKTTNDGSHNEQNTALVVIYADSAVFSWNSFPFQTFKLTSSDSFVLVPSSALMHPHFGELTSLSFCSNGLAPFIIISRVPRGGWWGSHECVVVTSRCISHVACCAGSFSQSPRS